MCDVAAGVVVAPADGGWYLIDALTGDLLRASTPLAELVRRPRCISTLPPAAQQLVRDQGVMVPCTREAPR